MKDRSRLEQSGLLSPCRHEISVDARSLVCSTALTISSLRVVDAGHQEAVILIASRRRQQRLIDPDHTYFLDILPFQHLKRQVTVSRSRLSLHWIFPTPISSRLVTPHTVDVNATLSHCSNVIRISPFSAGFSSQISTYCRASQPSSTRYPKLDCSKHRHGCSNGCSKDR